ncbi:DUF3019 domain-containing protein [Pseudoalteromonas holothuriae]|nr:DUF3019 domain-containing protein [Pseudoalteromonas sp. CIP111951]
MMTLITHTTIKAGLVCIAILGHSNTHAANEPNQQLSVSPKQCTTLEQGQDCYIDLTINWQANITGNYCLYANTQRLQCWHNKNQGTLNQEFIMNEPTQIRLEQNQIMLQQVTIKYAWLYKRRVNKAVKWRMF